MNLSRRNFLKNAGKSALTLLTAGTFLSQVGCDNNNSNSAVGFLPSSPTADKLKLEGGFIEFWGGMLTDQSFTALGDCAWKQVLQAMRDLQMNTVIIKRTQTNETDFIKPKDLPGIILDLAQSSFDMQVFLGLRNTNAWDPTVFSDKSWREEEKNKNLSLVQTVWDRYKSKERFAGWYITQEIGNEPGWYNLLSELEDYYGTICKKCKELAPTKPIALSPYFNPYSTAQDYFLEPDRFAEEYAKLLDTLKHNGKYLIDIVMLQDSVGERKIPPADFSKYVVPYFEAFAKICAERKIDFWGNIESFNNLGDNKRVPTDAKRLAAQIKAPSGLVKKLVTFDFFHYMNRYNHLYYDTAFKKAQQDLYGGYNAEFVKNDKLKTVNC